MELLVGHRLAIGNTLPSWVHLLYRIEYGPNRSFCCPFQTHHLCIRPSVRVIPEAASPHSTEPNAGRGHFQQVWTDIPPTSASKQALSSTVLLRSPSSTLPNVPGRDGGHLLLASLPFPQRPESQRCRKPTSQSLRLTPLAPGRRLPPQSAD